MLLDNCAEAILEITVHTIRIRNLCISGRFSTNVEKIPAKMAMHKKIQRTKEPSILVLI
jgi:hypothetical protein